MSNSQLCQHYEMNLEALQITAQKLLGQQQTISGCTFSWTLSCYQTEQEDYCGDLVSEGQNNQLIYHQKKPTIGKGRICHEQKYKTFVNGILAKKYFGKYLMFTEVKCIITRNSQRNTKICLNCVGTFNFQIPLMLNFHQTTSM